MMALTDAGTSDNARALLELGVFGGCAVLFAMQERRAADPMISFSIWSRRPIAATNIATVLTGMAMMGLTTFLPMYVQGVLHRSPVVAGFALTTMMVGWPVGATLGARSFHRFGLRQLLVAGAVLIPGRRGALRGADAGQLARDRRARLARDGLRHGHLERDVRSC